MPRAAAPFAEPVIDHVSSPFSLGFPRTCLGRRGCGRPSVRPMGRGLSSQTLHFSSSGHRVATTATLNRYARAARRIRHASRIFRAPAQVPRLTLFAFDILHTGRRGRGPPCRPSPVRSLPCFDRTAGEIFDLLANAPTHSQVSQKGDGTIPSRTASGLSASHVSSVGLIEQTASASRKQLGLDPFDSGPIFTGPVSISGGRDSKAPPLLTAACPASINGN